MPACTFFGHRNCPRAIDDRLIAVLENLITQHKVDMFYVGNHGGFDSAVHRALIQMHVKYPHIDYAIVLVYMPTQQTSLDMSHTLFPEEIAMAHPRFAISKRNDWMLQQANYVIAYITHQSGGAAQFVRKAYRQNKTVIPLADSELLVPYEV